MTTLRQEITSLRAENTLLREKLAAHRKVDGDEKWSIVSAVSAVAKNLGPLKQEERERVLLATAVLYGIIKPGPSVPSSTESKG